MLIELKDTIVSAEIFKRKFVCDLTACKGACCIEGDAGAPLTTDEVSQIENQINPPVVSLPLPWVTPTPEPEVEETPEIEE